VAERRIGRRIARVTDALSGRAYTLRPARPLAVRVAMWGGVCVFSATLGAAALAGWNAQRAGVTASRCAPEPVDEDRQQTELARTRLALAQESAARAAVQKTADSAFADVARLNAELRFLRGQGAVQPAASRR
jgi:hypothetical protein